MDIFSILSNEDEWTGFYEHKKLQGNLSESELRDLKNFIQAKEYLPVIKKLSETLSFNNPQKALINKSVNGKKRTVYIFSREENYLLKLLSHVLLRYDHLFADNLYSFRKHKSAQNALSDIRKIKNLSVLYSYKVDISDYFNSVNVNLLLPKLKDFLKDDTLFSLIKGLLCNPYCVYDGGVIKQQKGILPGVAISAFLANFYLMELDFYFSENGIPYARYSDDIIVFAENEEQIKLYSNIIKDFLNKKELSVNCKKEAYTKPFEKWEFLGFSYCNGTVDISNVSFDKLKAKLRRKTHALSRWADRKGVERQFAARAFIKRLNTRLYDNPVHSELTWAKWYFPVINTDETLKQIDAYATDCIRFLYTKKRTKARFDLDYSHIKALGFRPLVNEYYKFRKNK